MKNLKFSMLKQRSSSKKENFFLLLLIFYILKDNTITTDLGEDDFMEKLYEKIDNSFAKILYTINNNNYEHRFGVNKDDMPYINNFVSQIYWRSPFNKNILQDYIKKYKLKQLGVKIVDEFGNHNEELSEKFKNEPEFYKAYKLYNSLLDSIRGFNYRTQYHICTRPKELPSICSDFPIIFKKNNLIKVYEDDYIFPLSQNRIFVKRNLTQRFNQ